MSDVDAGVLGHVFGLIVHDLRNPVATISANVEFLGQVGGGDEDAEEAHADTLLALDDLRRGLEQISWIGRWLGGQDAIARRDGDLVMVLQQVARAHPQAEVEVPSGPLLAHGGASVRDVLDLLIRSGERHGRRAPVRVRAYRQDAEVVVDVCDAGPPLAPELRELAFTLDGQSELKGHPAGRYARYLGLVAAHAAVQSLGGRLEADERDGGAVFRVRLTAT